MRALLLPVLDADPPAAYVDFVARNLARLRGATLRVVDDPHRADLLYPEVLTDVALAWRRLELARRRGHPDAADEYLDQCLHRRLYPPFDDGGSGWAGGGPADFDVRFVVWDADDSGHPDLPPPARQNAAVRLAAHLLPFVDPEPAPLAEATIAWWHAYEQHRRRRQIAATVAGLVVVLYPLALVSTSGASF